MLGRLTVNLLRRYHELNDIVVGIIGGTGIYQMDSLSDVKEIDIDTPFGKPSAPIITGKLSDIGVAFIPRHGRGHIYSPSEIPALANIYALKTIGVRKILSISAVGSLKEEIKPLDLVIPDQIIDRTRYRTSTFFGNGVVAHVGMANPFCPEMSAVLKYSSENVGDTVHLGGTYVVMEGPQFSTKAESELYRSWGADVIGMTAMPEAKLAREAEICYCVLACATDYDCWLDSETPVTVDMVVNNLRKNVALSKSILSVVVPHMAKVSNCVCGSALENSIITDPGMIPDEARMKLSLFLDKYLH